MRVLIAGDRPQDREIGRKSALRLGLDCAADDCVPLADLRLRLAREPAVHVVVVCVDPDPDTAARAIKSATGQTRQPIYAVTSNGDGTVDESIRQAGAAAVWPLDRLREGLLSSSEDIRREGTAGDRRGRVVAVTAALPGSGVTTVATGLAFALAGTQQVVLVEFGATTPELALDLDLNTRHWLSDLIRASDRLDARMIREAAAQHPAGAHILAHPPETLTPDPLTAAVCRDFQILLRGLYDWVVADAGHVTGSGAGGSGEDELLRHADAVVLVTRLDPPGLRLAKRHMIALVGQGVKADRFVVVANRYGQSGQVSWRKVEEVLGTPVVSWLPDDPKSVNRALAEGRPLVQVARGSRLTRELSSLAAAIQGRFTPAR
jgi:Flp pilus assembly CpaE family ATPase